MDRIVEEAVSRAAAAMAPGEPVPGASWRWGTVVADDGATLDVEVGGSTLYGVPRASDVTAPVGARVRVAYLVTDALVDASVGQSGGGGPSPSSSTPLMDGTASAGTSDDYARGDHVHPTDTSRQAALSVETGTLTSGSAASSYSSSLTRYGKVVTLDMYSLKLASALSSGSTSGTIATVPSGYRPSTNVYCAIGSTGAHGGSYARITTAGVVTIRNSSGTSIATSAELCLTITYIIS